MVRSVRSGFVLSLLLVFGMSLAHANSTEILSFQGLKDQQQVGNFYNGGGLTSTPNFGVTFVIPQPGPQQGFPPDPILLVLIDSGLSEKEPKNRRTMNLAALPGCGNPLPRGGRRSRCDGFQPTALGPRLPLVQQVRE